MIGMRSSRIRGILSSLVVAAAAGGCGGTVSGGVQTPPPAAPTSEGERAAIARARADSARYPYTKADVHFMSAMISHHAQAIRMAGWAPTHDAGPSVRILAERIINAQEDEIGIMQQWLRERRLPAPEANDTGMKGHHAGMDHAMQMPGMLSAAEMRELDAARGAEFDRRFLFFMIKHHQGATHMVKELFSTHGAGQDEMVFRFASDVNVDQTTEIARMQRMLVALEFERRAQ